MNFINSLSGMNLNPITNYNNQLNNNKAFDIDSGEISFDNILNQQASLQNTFTVKGGIQMNNIDDVAAKSAIEPLSDNSSTGTLIKSFSNSINGGLNSVNNSIHAADKAQEALAMGEDISVHDVMIAAEKAALSMQMTMQLRNKLITAYNEINNVRI